MNLAATSRAGLLTAMALAAALAGCSRTQPDKHAKPAAPAEAPVPEAATKPAAETDKYAPLMRAVFKDGYRPAKGDAVANLPDPEKKNATMPMVLKPVGMTTLPSGETVLALNGEMADANGNAQSAHASPGYLSMYLLRETEGVWDVVKKLENIDTLGSFGNIGEARWVKQTNGRVLLAVEGGGVWQGYFIKALSLYDPAANTVRDLVGDGGLLLASGSGGGCGPTTAHCWDMKASWRFAPSTTGERYDDLVLVISGYNENAVKAAPPEGEAADTESTEAPAAEAEEPDAGDEEKEVQRERKTISATARYVFDKATYRLKIGSNPIPGI